MSKNLQFFTYIEHTIEINVFPIVLNLWCYCNDI